MQKYKKTVEAVQWNGMKEGPHDLGITRAAAPCGQGWLPSHGPVPTDNYNPIPDGAMISPGDYVIRDRDGLFHALKRAYFEWVYDLVPEGDRD